MCAFARFFSARASAVFAACSSSLGPFFAVFGSFFAFYPALPGYPAFAALAAAARTPVISSSSSRRAYQMSIVRICAKPAIASR